MGTFEEKFEGALLSNRFRETDVARVDGRPSNQHGLHDFSAHVGQAVIAALKVVRSVHGQNPEMQQVACRSWTWTGSGDVETKVIRLPKRHARLDAAAGQPHAETARMMVAAILLMRELSLAIDGAAKFTTPNDQGLVQQAALLQVANRADCPWSTSDIAAASRASRCRDDPSRDDTVE